MNAMHLLADRSIEEGVDRRIERCRTWEDGARLGDGATAQVRSADVQVAGELVLTGYPAGWHLDSPATRPLALFEDAVRLDAPVTLARLRCCWLHIESPGQRRAHYWELLELTWQQPVRWRPAAPREGRAPLLPSASLLVLGLAQPEGLVVDLDAAAAILEAEGRAPGGPSRLARARHRGADLPSWRSEDETERYVLGELIERAADAEEERCSLTVAPLQPGAAPVVLWDPGDDAILGRMQVVTLWEALGEDGEVCGVAAVPSLKPELQDAEAGPWDLGADLGSRPTHGTLSGAGALRRPERPHESATWAGHQVSVTYEEEDTGEAWSETNKFLLRSLGQIAFPSERIYLADPLAVDTGGRLLDLKLAHPGPYPILEVVGSDDARGLLVLIGAGEPATWGEGVARDGGDAAPTVNTGAVAVIDHDAVPWLEELRSRPADAICVYSGPADLLRSDPVAAPDVAILTDIGGDVPIYVSLGLDAHDHPVALLIGNEDFATFESVDGPPVD
jgi:hypothetical protein